MQKNERRMLLFAIRYPNGWHSCAPDSVGTMRNLARLGFLETIEYGRKAQPQFRLLMQRTEEKGSEPSK